MSILLAGKLATLTPSKNVASIAIWWFKCFVSVLAG